MKIGIIGAGSTSAVALLQVIKFDSAFRNGFQVQCINDPNIPIAKVGESTSPPVFNLLKNVLNLEWPDLSEFHGTLRYYTKYYWEPATGQDFSVYHAYAGIHLDSQEFSKYVFRELKSRFPFFSEISDTVVKLEQNEYSVAVHGNDRVYEFDYVIDCRGTPSDEVLDSDEYETDNIFRSVNSAILYPDFVNKYDEPFTSSYVHKNGWMFGVPLQHRKTFGYLYNNTITSKEEASNHFAELKGIDTSNLSKFTWRQYYKKQAMTGRVFTLGNKLYFFEPHQALPLHYYSASTEQFMKMLIENAPPEVVAQSVNNMNQIRMEQMQDMIALNYVCENKLESDFWNYQRPRAIEHLKNSHHWQEYIQECKTQGKICRFSFHPEIIMQFYINGYKINLDNLCQ
jgi:hypothetical protein